MSTSAPPERNENNISMGSSGIDVNENHLTGERAALETATITVSLVSK